MKKILFFLMGIFLCMNILYGQKKEIIKLTQSEIETIFLNNSLELIAEKMNISIADAEIIQAKLWENPSFSISGVNLWSTKNQREGKSEVIPPLFGTFARNTQFSIELSQLIQTANKRGKLIAREKVSKEIAVQQFEAIMLGLKIELRKSINEIIYLQNYCKVLSMQQESLVQFTDSYKKQVLQGNIAKSELLRLQSSLLEIENEKNETLGELNEQIKTLKSLLSADPLLEIEVIESEMNALKPESLILSQLLEQSTDNRVNVKLSKLQKQYFEKSLAYEKAQRIPDITVSANYDRLGGVWKDFIGFGISADLPLFNRNQGAIKAAQLSHEQSIYQEKQQVNQVQYEVVEAYNNYLQAYQFYKKTSADNLLSELDRMIDTYSKNLINKNISMLEYIDFMEAYKSNKQTVLVARKKMQIQFEELQYVIGKEIK